MSAAAPYGDDALTPLEPGGGIPEPIAKPQAEPLLARPAAVPPANKPFRLHPEWAQRGPFW
jgi:hypothetical protein